MTYNPRNSLHELITACAMIVLGLIIALYDGAWLLIIPIIVATLSAGGWAGMLVAICAHALHILRFDVSVSNISMMVMDVAIVVLLQSIEYRMRQRFIYTSLYPAAIGCIVSRSVMIVIGMWVQNLFVPQASVTRSPIDMLTMMISGPALIMTAVAIIGVLVVNSLLRIFLP